MERPLQDSQGRDDRQPDARWILRWTAGLFVLGLALRAIHLWTLRDEPFAGLPLLDAAMYDDWGRALARGEARGGVYFQDPLYAWFLGIVYRVFGPEPTAALVVQSVLGAMVGPLILVAAAPWFGRSVAMLAGTIAALYLPSIYYDGLLLKTSLAVFLVALLMAQLALTPQRRPRIGLVLAGIVLGLACLTRGNLRLLVPVVLVWILTDARLAGATEPAQRSSWRDPSRLTATTAFLIGVAIVLAPTAVRNRVVGGEWVLTTGNVGQNLYIGNNPSNETGGYARLPFVDPNPKYEQRDFAAEAARRLGRRPGVRESSAFWRDEALRWIGRYPGRWLRLTALKLRVYWAAYEMPDNFDYGLYRESAPVLRLPIPGFGLLAPFGLLGAGLAWRRPGWPRLLVLVVLFYSLSVVLFFVLARFRMAMLPAFVVLAAYGMVETLRRARQAWTRRKVDARTAAGLAVLLALFAFVNLPVRAREGSLALRVARSLGLPSRVEHGAIARFNLGVAYAKRAGEAEDPDRWLALAERQLRLAWRDESRYASVPIELGKVLARQDRNREAIEVYREAARIEPDNYRIHHALGLLAERIGQEHDAEQAYRRALELEPRHVASAIRLGESLMRQGRRVEAAELFRYALRLAPDNARAREGLRLSAPGSP